ncbi:MAG TPA: prephenate dehydrogenase [Chitinophagaceae bacterium]|nr:prephenate dehydrogenase [Chitinophagaceae bacterium]
MTVTIIGIGLIGGSLALSLKEKGIAERIIGVDRNADNGAKALELGLVDEISTLENAMYRSQLVILAVPVDVLVELLPRVLDLTGTRQVIADMGSVKANIAAAVDGHPMRSRYVSLHPMAGTEYSGPEAAVHDLFTGKTLVFCDVGKSEPEAVLLLEGIADRLDMRRVYLETQEHDLHTAYVSHIAHITSFALALTVLEKEKEEQRIFELASGGFESTVRLAKSSPDMWVPIFRQNKHNVLDVLEEHIRQLNRMKSLMEQDDFEQFYALIEQSNKIRKIIK